MDPNLESLYQASELWKDQFRGFMDVGDKNHGSLIPQHLACHHSDGKGN